MKKLFVIVLLFSNTFAYGASDHRCSSNAIAQAKKLLEFHFGVDERIEIDQFVKVRKPLTNPASKGQTFDVLEVWGYIYKAKYRMRFIYARQPTECLLMGQEILEYAKL